MLEDEVDEKYYLSDRMVNFFFENEKIQREKGNGIKVIKPKDVWRLYGVFDTEKSKHQAGSVYDKNGLSPTLDTMQGGWRQPLVEVENK